METGRRLVTAVGLHGLWLTDEARRGWADHRGVVVMVGLTLCVCARFHAP